MSESTMIKPVTVLSEFADKAEKKSDRWLFLVCFGFIIVICASGTIYAVRQNQSLIADLKVITVDQISANKQMAVALDRNSRVLEANSTASLGKDTNGHN